MTNRLRAIHQSDQISGVYECALIKILTRCALIRIGHMYVIGYVSSFRCRLQFELALENGGGWQSTR